MKKEKPIFSTSLKKIEERSDFLLKMKDREDAFLFLNSHF